MGQPDPHGKRRALRRQGRFDRRAFRRRPHRKVGRRSGPSRRIGAHHPRQGRDRSARQAGRRRKLFRFRDRPQRHGGRRRDVCARRRRRGHRRPDHGLSGRFYRHVRPRRQVQPVRGAVQRGADRPAGRESGKAPVRGSDPRRRAESRRLAGRLLQKREDRRHGSFEKARWPKS